MDKKLQTLLRVCSVFGICWEIPNCCGQNCSYFFGIYFVLLMVLLILSCVLGIMKSEILNQFVISWTVSTSVFISQMLTHVIIMYEAITKHKEHKNFVQIIEDIDVYFQILLKMDVKMLTVIGEFCCGLIILTIISKIGVMVFALTILVHSDVGYFWWALLAILAMRFRLIQVIAYAEILKYYMRALNRKLSQVVCLITEESKQVLDIDYKHFRSIDVIKNIKHIYAALHEASTLMNEFSQASLFAASAANCLDLTCHIYWTLLAFDNVLPPYNIVSSLATIIPLALLMFKFCYICQVIKDESRRTSLLLSRLISSGVYPLTNKKYKNLLHDFCMQLMHQPLVFTGSRFFTFDLKCIFAICALIATHLIILIQFTKSDTSHNLNETSTKRVGNELPKQ